MPDFLVSDNRDQTASTGLAAGGPVRIGVMLNGEVFQQIGTDILNAGWDPTQGINAFPHGAVRRFMGQIWTHTLNLASFTQLAIRCYDEGGIDDWPVIVEDTVGPGTAKGGKGRSYLADASRRYSPILEVLTEDRPYLVGCYHSWSGVVACWVYNPDTNAIVEHLAVGFGWTSANIFINGFVHDGLTYWAAPDGLTQIVSFDPATGVFIHYDGATFGYQGGATTGNQFKPHFFSLHDRLFCATMDISNAIGENAFTSRVVEFALGVWTEVSTLDTNMGDRSNQGARMAVFKLSTNKILTIGYGSERDITGGLVANVLTTVGDSPTGALQNTPGTISTTNAVIPVGLRPSSGSYGGPGISQSGVRCYGTTVTDDPTGQVRHFLYYVPDGSLTATAAILYEVIDDVTPIVLVAGSPGIDSDFAFPHSFYGGGAESGGIDGSTRYVSVQARGWTDGNTGIRVKMSAHGDAMVIAHRSPSGVFTVGEDLTWTGGGGVLIGDGANEGFYVRDVFGTLPVQDGTITGVSSTETTTVNGVLLHTGVTGIQYEVAEILTGSLSGATAPVTHIGIGGGGEQLVKVGVVTGGPFVINDVLTGGTNGGTSTMSTAPRGYHGGLANKTIRARFADGKDVPSGFATFVAGTGIGCTVSKGTGPSSSDELINVVADGAPGDTPISAEWDFATDGVSPLAVSTLILEIERPNL